MPKIIPNVYKEGRFILQSLNHQLTLKTFPSCVWFRACVCHTILGDTSSLSS